MSPKSDSHMAPKKPGVDCRTSCASAGLEASAITTANAVNTLERKAEL
ncbi:MAG: hypothetical protein ACM3SR_07250 [Ignavibacteriales bacterium]